MQHKFTLKEYIALASCYLVVKENLQAQIYYHDYSPNVILNGGFDALTIDLNEDGIDEILFTKFIFTSYYDAPFGFVDFEVIAVHNFTVSPDDIKLEFAASRELQITGYGTFYRYYPFAFPPGKKLDSTRNFEPAAYQILAYNESIDGDSFNQKGHWFPEVLDHYIGFRFPDEEGQKHYGWVRCSVLNNGEVLIIKDYAYEETPDRPIKTGSTENYVPVSEIENTLEASIYSFNNTVYLYLHTEANEETEIRITDITGKLIYEETCVCSQKEIHLQVAHGIYFVELRNGEKRCYQKVYL